MKISGLDKRQSIMLGVVAAIGLVAGFYMLYLDPSKKKVADIRRQIEAKDKELQTARMHADLFRPLKEKVAKLEEQLSLLRAKLATKGEIISLIKTIEDEAQRLDMKVINMYANVQEPPPPPPKEEKETDKETPPQEQMPGYSKVILDVNLQGRFDKLEGFLKTLQNIKTFLVIEKLDISGDEDIYPLLTSSTEINFYSEKGIDNSAIAE